MTVQLAARGGASAVAVTTSSADRGDRLRKLGATHVLDRSGQGGQDAPPGYDVIIDIVAGADMPAFFARLNPNGRMVVVGVVAGYPPADFGMMIMMTAFQKSLSFATFSTDTVPEPGRRAVRTEQFEAASRGELQMVVHEVLPLEQAVPAHLKMARRRGVRPDRPRALGKLADRWPGDGLGRALRQASRRWICTEGVGCSSQ